jgi:hypothetical protein
LGINVDQCTWLRKNAEHTSKAAKKALWAMIRRFQDMNTLCLDTKIILFNTLVLPIANYACRTWGVYYLLPVESSIFTNMRASLDKIVPVEAKTGKKNTTRQH